MAAASEPESPAKREHCKRTIGLVACLQRNIAAPEVVSKDLRDGSGARIHVIVVDYRFAVVKNEVAPAAIGEAGQRQAGH